MKTVSMRRERIEEELECDLRRELVYENDSRIDLKKDFAMFRNLRIYSFATVQ